MLGRNLYGGTIACPYVTLIVRWARHFNIDGQSDYHKGGQPHEHDSEMEEIEMCSLCDCEKNVFCPIILV